MLFLSHAVSVISCCLSNHPNPQSLTANVCYLTISVSVSQELVCSSPACLWLRFLLRLPPSVCLGCHHLKAQLGVSPLLSSATWLLPGPGPCLGFAWGHPFLTMWASAWCRSQHGSWLPLERKSERGSPRWKPLSFVTLSQKSHLITSVVFYMLKESQYVHLTPKRRELQ